jgi:hypothetical protein
MNVPENPQAFPNSWEETNQHGVTFPYVERGMTLRDYFAGQALAQVKNTDSPQELAFWCYEVADAMLTARQEPSA